MNNIILTETTKKNLVDEILKGVQTLINASQEKDLLKSEWLTAKEVMTILKITPVTLWNYDNKGLTVKWRYVDPLNGAS